MIKLCLKILKHPVHWCVLKKIRYFCFHISFFWAKSLKNILVWASLCFFNPFLVGLGIESPSNGQTNVLCIVTPAHSYTVMKFVVSCLKTPQHMSMAGSRTCDFLILNWLPYHCPTTAPLCFCAKGGEGNQPMNYCTSATCD